MRGSKNVSIVTHLVREETGFKLNHSEHKVFTLGTYITFWFSPLNSLNNLLCAGQQRGVHSNTP